MNHQITTHQTNKIIYEYLNCSEINGRQYCLTNHLSKTFKETQKTKPNVENYVRRIRFDFQLDNSKKLKRINRYECKNCEMSYIKEMICTTIHTIHQEITII